MTGEDSVAEMRAAVGPIRERCLEIARDDGDATWNLKFERKLDQLKRKA